jgi:hypothetical protein
MKIRLLILAAVMMVGGGCSSLLPTERQQTQSVKASENIAAQHELTIKRALETGPEMAFRISTSTNDDVRSVPLRENLEITSKTTNKAGSAEAANGSSEVSLPAGVKMGLLGGGLGILGFVLRWLWNYVKSTGAGQVISIADGLLSNYLDGWREHAQTTINPQEVADANIEIAALQEMRGKLLAQGRKK